jgi:hypothetical protein
MGRRSKKSKLKSPGESGLFVCQMFAFKKSSPEKKTIKRFRAKALFIVLFFLPPA